MTRVRVLFFLVLALFLAACAAGDSQPATPAPAATASDSTPEPAATLAATASDALQVETPAAGDGDLTGRLYYIGTVDRQQHLLTLDLATGEETTLLIVPASAWLSEVAASPDGQQLLLAYAPTPEGNQAQFGFTALYVMPADASGEPELLIPQEDPSESFFNISWPLDDTIYYAHYAPSVDEQGIVQYASQIERAHLSNGEVEALVSDAAWPRLSAGGSRLAYVTEAGDLILAAADGSLPEPFLGSESFAAVDAPLFSLDGSQLYFSAVDLPQATSLSPLDRLLGVQVAQAHSVPSDWWQLPLEGDRQQERLTNIDKIGLYGDFDDDGSHLYFVAADGVYMMAPDGQDLIQLATIPTVPTIDWTP